MLQVCSLCGRESTAGHYCYIPEPELLALHGEVERLRNALKEIAGFKCSCDPEDLDDCSTQIAALALADGKENVK